MSLLFQHKEVNPCISLAYLLEKSRLETVATVTSKQCIPLLISRLLSVQPLAGQCWWLNGQRLESETTASLIPELSVIFFFSIFLFSFPLIFFILWVPHATFNLLGVAMYGSEDIYLSISTYICTCRVSLNFSCFAHPIRQYSSTLYVGLQHAVPPTNTKFKTLLFSTQAVIHKHSQAQNIIL